MVHDRVLIDGTYVKNVLGTLSYPPSSTVLDGILANPRDEARYYIEAQVVTWDGELVTTVFVHISLRGNTLYIKFSTHALPPTPPRFHVIDEVRGRGPAAALRMALQSLSKIPGVLYAPRRLLAAPKLLVNAYRAQRDIKEIIAKRQDIGAQISAREIAGYDIGSDSGEACTPRQHPEDTGYFQLFDVARHSKIIERRLLAAIEEFLKVKEVDTSEFVHRVEAVLNSGIVNIHPSGTNTVGGDSDTGYQANVGGTVPVDDPRY
jgi:hypothetical protein